MAIQVQSATKDGQGYPLSIINRQFISFSYGGINIEDFNLLAVFNNDRLEKEIYASFDDTTTEQAELDGQLFWRSNFKAGELSFTLATDGITSQELEDFKNWFKPGIEKELILSEYHNRGILARVSAAPKISLLPFEQETQVLVNGVYYPLKTSLYKGEITLDFIMDDPYWYSKESYLKNLDENSIKLIYEDGIPHSSMLSTQCFLANNQYCNENYEIEENLGISLQEEKQETRYLYYCGTANARPEISFEIEPFYSDSGEITFYKSTSSSHKYYYLRIGEHVEGTSKNYLYFTLPSLFTSYNKALEIARKYTENTSVLELKKELRDLIYDYYTRSYVMAIIDIAQNNDDKIYVTSEGKITDKFITYFTDEMKNFFTGNLICTINCKNGIVTISGNIKIYNGTEMVSQTITENAGNMIKSDYLTIETRVLPKDGRITANECLAVNTNSNLFNLKINYKYMYL